MSIRVDKKYRTPRKFSTIPFDHNLKRNKGKGKKKPIDIWTYDFSSLIHMSFGHFLKTYYTLGLAYKINEVNARRILLSDIETIADHTTKNNLNSVNNAIFLKYDFANRNPTTFADAYVSDCDVPFNLVYIARKKKNKRRQSILESDGTPSLRFTYSNSLTQSVVYRIDRIFKDIMETYDKELADMGTHVLYPKIKFTKPF